jgi:hypothetical protein
MNWYFTYSIVQRGIFTIYSWILTWWAPNTESSVVPQFGVTHTGRFWRQCKRTNSAFQHTASYSTHRVQWFIIKRIQFFQSFYICPLWFSHCLLSWTNATHFSYTENFQQVEQSILQGWVHFLQFQNKTQVMLGLLDMVQRIQYPSVHTQWHWRRNEGCSLLTQARNWTVVRNTVSNERKTAEEDPFRWQIGLSNPWWRQEEVKWKYQFRHSRSGVSSESEEEDGLEKESEYAADAERLYCAGLFYEDHGGEDWVWCQKAWSGLTKFVRTIRNGPVCVCVCVCVLGVRYDRLLCAMAAKCHEEY